MIFLCRETVGYYVHHFMILLVQISIVNVSSEEYTNGDNHRYTLCVESYVRRRDV